MVVSSLLYEEVKLNNSEFFNYKENPYGLEPSESGKDKNYNWEDKYVLIVEDDPVNMLYLKKILKKSNINIYGTDNGRDAVELCLNKKIDIILMDIRLPGIDGFEATRIIKKNNPEIAVIAQTANVLEDDKNEAADSGCNDFLYKPIDKEALLNLMAKYL